MQRDPTAFPRAGLLRGLVLLCLFSLPGSRWAVSVCPAAETDWGAYGGWQVTAFKLEGAPPRLAGDLAKGLALNGERKLLTGRQLPKFSERMLAEDLARIRLFLARRGYPAAGPVPVATPARDKRELALVINVNPGAPVRIGRLQFEGWPDDVAAPDSALPGIPAVGDIVTDARVAASVDALRSDLRNQGFAQANVTRQISPLGPGKVAISFRVTAGDRYRITDIVVTGCSENLVPLARRVMDIAPGIDYSDSRLADATLDLRLTRLFRQVELETAVIGPGELRLTARLEDSRQRSWDASVGTWSDNPWMVKSDWMDRNAFGGGKGYFARASYATHEAQVGAGVFWLGWLSPRARTQLALDHIREDEEAYVSREFRLALIQSFRPRGRDILNFGSAISNNEIRETVVGNSTTPEAQGRLWEFWVDRKWDRTNDPIFPSQGGWLKVSLTTSEPWVVSEVPYSSAQLDAAAYRGLGGRSVLTGRVRVGVARAMRGENDVLANRRFHAGGYNSHRGYRRRSLGPRDAADNPRGGEAVLLLSGEVRFPLFWLFEGAAFVDAGDVWAVVEDMAPAKLPLATGLALSLRSPIGPLRVGYARNLANQVAGEPRDLWHFGIGYPW